MVGPFDKSSYPSPRKLVTDNPGSIKQTPAVLRLYDHGQEIWSGVIRGETIKISPNHAFPYLKCQTWEGREVETLATAMVAEEVTQEWLDQHKQEKTSE